MIKIAPQDFSLPLREKIKILGLRVATSDYPENNISNQVLYLSDDWNIQLVFVPLNKRDDEVPPQLLEFKVAWKEQFNWTDENQRQVSVSYKKKPRSTSYFIHEGQDKKICLNLSLEAVLEIDFAIPTPQEHHISPVIEERKNQQEDKRKQKESSDKVLSLDQKITQILDRIKVLEERTSNLEEKLHEPDMYSTISGSVRDAHRMSPISKAIIEFYPQGSSEPLIKLATNNQGKYSLEQLIPGIYDIKIRHPRYLLLEVNKYVIEERDNLSQDFLLRRS